MKRKGGKKRGQMEKKETEGKKRIENNVRGEKEEESAINDRK